MHDLDLILTLTGGLAAALVCGYVTFRLGLSPIVGYLLAGFVVGPNTPGFVADRHLAEQFAEVGVILLMFGVGLRFHIKELLAVRKVAVPGALGQIAFTTVLGSLAGVALGWGWTAGVIFGLAISVASTVVLLRILEDNDDLHTATGHIAVGWLVLEDLFTVLVLVLLPALFADGQFEPAGAGLALGIALVKLGAMVGLVLVVGERVIPWLLDRAAATRSREIFTLTVLVVALGIAVGASKVFGVSMALGAFLAGLVVGRSEFSLRAATEALPMRDAFAVLFFVSVGILFRPGHLIASPGSVAAALAIILIGKPLASLVIVLAMGYPSRVAVSVGVALAQIGEFSFILATASKELGLIEDGVTNTLIAASILSITLNPILYRLIEPIERMLGRFVKSTSTAADVASLEGEGTDHRLAVIVGHGPVGRTLDRLLRASDFEPVIIEMNVETVRAIKSQGHLAVYGDAGHRDILEAAGTRRAVVLVLSGSSLRGAGETIRLARELNPAIAIYARSNYLRDRERLRRAGADVVFTGEGEVAMAMTEALLRRLGATPEEVDRERSRIRAEFLDEIPDPPIPRI